MLKLVAMKLQSFLAVEGELPEDGLAAYGDNGDGLMLALARQIVNGQQEADAETVEAVFAQARDGATRAEELLVEAKPEAVEFNGTRTNGHHANGTGSSQEFYWAATTGCCPGKRHWPSRRTRWAAADAVLLGGVNGRAAGEAQGPPPQGSGPGAVPV